MWISTDAANDKAVYDALREFGAPLADLSAADFAQEGYFYQMGVPPVRVDILMGIPGVAFEEAWPKRMTSGAVPNRRRTNRNEPAVGSAREGTVRGNLPRKR